MVDVALSPSDRVRWVLVDAVTVAKRNLIKTSRVPQQIVFSTSQPVTLLLLFAYVFGGAVNTPGVPYRSFLVPGIFVQVVAFSAVTTGIGHADDLDKGLIDRFRSLPMARSAVLAGRTLADLVRNVFSLLLVLGVGYAIGFRIRSAPHEAAAAFLLLLLFGYVLSWVGSAIAVVLRDPEAVQAASYVWLFPLVFASGLFVPVDSMPGWLQPFARYQPIGAVGETVRALLLDLPLGSHGWRALAWCAGLLAVVIPLSVRRYRRT